jgi:hypothetical protein
MWNGSYFVPGTLAQHGLRVQLSHFGRPCYTPKPAHQDFVVIDIHGIQVVAMDYCGCGLSMPEAEQLLRERWYPASVLAPRTACTFRVLKHFQLLTLQGKLSAYDFYTSLARLTDNSGITSPPVGAPPAMLSDDNFI